MGLYQRLIQEFEKNKSIRHCMKIEGAFAPVASHLNPSAFGCKSHMLSFYGKYMSC